jgi:hypothetical protein
MTENEILALKNFYAENSDEVIGLEIEWGIEGIGGTNRSSYRSGGSRIIPISELAGKPVSYMGESTLLALIDGVLYFERNGILRSSRDCSFLGSRGVAYDTYQSFYVYLIGKDGGRME